MCGVGLGTKVKLRKFSAELYPLQMLIRPSTCLARLPKPNWSRPRCHLRLQSILCLQQGKAQRQLALGRGPALQTVPIQKQFTQKRERALHIVRIENSEEEKEKIEGTVEVSKRTDEGHLRKSQRRDRQKWSE